MREFFRGWKRKVGCVALTIACLFAAGWVRSFVFADWIERSSLKIISFDGGVCWEQTRNLHEFMRKPSISSASADSVLEEYRFSNPSAHWKRQLLGFGRKTYGGESRNIGGLVYNSAFSIYRVPYWSIVVPLTLLSAYLC